MTRLDRLESVDRQNEGVNGEDKLVEYKYDLAGNTTQITYPKRPNPQDPLIVTRHFDNADRMDNLTAAQGSLFTRISQFQYDADNNLNYVNYSDADPDLDAHTDINYDPVNRFGGITHTVGSTILLSVNYQRDNNGLVNVAQESANGTGGSHTYGYDSLDRLKTDTLVSNSSTVTSTWDYDAASQIYHSEVTTAGQPTVSTSRDYDDGGELRTLTETTGTTTSKRLSLEYDPKGNRSVMTNAIAGQSTYFAYNAADQLASFDNHNSDYIYDGDGLRQYKVVGGGLYYLYAWDTANSTPLLLQDQAAQYIYGPGGMLLAEYSDLPGGSQPERPGQPKQGKDAPQTTWAFYYYMMDQQGSVRAEITDAGGVSATYSYDAYGTQSAGVVAPLYNRFGFVGQYRDDESELLYMQARYYDPITQQFLSKDPLEGISGQPYTYAWGNPVNYSDPTGSMGRWSSLFDSNSNQGGEGEPSAGVGRLIGEATAGLKPSVSGGLQAARSVDVEATSETQAVDPKSGIGTFKEVGGHHIHAKAAFRGNPAYDLDEALSISYEYMSDRGWRHEKMTPRQQQLFIELGKSGKPNTLREHSRIAVEALIAGGASREDARSLVARSLLNLRAMGIRDPGRIPWYDR